MGKVLMIEDDELLGRLNCYFLKKQGHEITWLRDFKETIVLLPNAKLYDIMVLDLVFNNQLEGLELLKKYRKVYTKRELPIIISSGLNKAINYNLVLELGANDYLEKPYTGEELIDIIDRNLK